MASEADGDEDVLFLVHQLPLDMDGDHERRLAHLLPPLHTGDAPSPFPPFRPPPPLQAATSAEPRLSFRGWLGAPRHWDLWVAKLRPIHADLWRRLGIHDAVLSSTYRFRRDASALLHLASFWCPRTNTFAFPWGEATVTLHDIALLVGFPANGAPVPAPLASEWRPDEAALNGVRLGFNRSACKKAHHSAWVKHFLTDDHGSSHEHEHAAFLALWLTRFVLPGHPESTMRQCLFPIAVRLARGERLALGPAVLASLYRDLRDIKAFLVAAAAAATTGNAEMLSSLPLYAPLYILQLWMWERFPALRPGRENPLMDGDPLSARWHDLSRKINPTLIREALSSADTFLWQPYTCSMHTTGWVRRSDLAENDDLRTLAHCLHPCELVGVDCIEQYLPHRVARQFGLDQDVPGDVPRANQNWAIAWHTYELEGKNVAFFIPQAEPGVTARYAYWWRQQLSRSDIGNTGKPSVPVEWKTSKRKVKKTLVAMEAEEEKERRLKKARVSPVTSDKKRKLEELYDTKMLNWLTAARNEISDPACGTYQGGSSLPKYDTALDEALLPNVGPTNDDVVLLVPRKQITSPTVMVVNDSSTDPAIEDRGILTADVPNEPEGGVGTTTMQEEKLIIPAPSVASSPDVTGSPEEGTTMVRGLETEATSASDTPKEVTAPGTKEKEENFTTECSCVAGMNASLKNIVVLTELDEHNAVSEEVGTAAEEAIEVATQIQQDVDACAMNSLHVIVALPEEACPIQHTNNGGVCSKVSCTMEHNNVAGGLSTDARETACHDFVVEEQMNVRSVEMIGGGGDHEITEKDNLEKPQEAPQKETVESARDTDLMGSGNEGENKTDPPTLEGVATSDSTTAALLGVLEAENAETMKDLNLEKKHTEVMPMQVTGEEAELEQANASTKGSTEEENKEFSEVNHADMDDFNFKRHSRFDMEKPGEAAGVSDIEIDGAKGAENAEVKRDVSLAQKDTKDMRMEVVGGEEAVNTLAKGGADTEHNKLSEVDHTYIVEPRMLLHTGIEKPEEADAVDCAEIDGTMRLTGIDSIGEKLAVVPEVQDDRTEKIRGMIVGIKDEKFAEVSEVEHGEVEDVKSMMEENTDNRSEDICILENTGSRETYGTVEEDTGGRLNEVHDVIAEVERSDDHEMDNDVRECVMQEDLQTRDDTPMEVGTKGNILADGNLRDEPLSEEDTKENPFLGGEGLVDKNACVSKEAYKVKQAAGEGCKVGIEEEEENINVALGMKKAGGQGQNKSPTKEGTEEIPEQTTHAQEMEFDKDFVDVSKSSSDGEISSSSLNVQVKGDQMEVSHKGMVQSQHILNDELLDQMEPSSDATAMMVEGVHEHNNLDTHKEASLKLEQDDYREKTILEGSHLMDSGVRPALATLEVNETLAGVVIQNHKNFGVEKQQVVDENNKMDMSKGADINPTGVEINEVKSTKGTQNQEPFNDKQQLAIEERRDLGTTAEINKIDRLQDANILSCSEYQINPSGIAIDENESTQRTQKQERFDNKVVMEERNEFIADRSVKCLKEAYSAGGNGENTFAFSADNSDSTQNKEACNMKLLSTVDKQHHGVENVNDKRILEDGSMASSGELDSDVTVLEVNIAGSGEGTLKCALGAEKETVVPEKDQGTADGNTKKDLADIVVLECGGMRPDVAGNTFHGPLLIAQSSNIAGPLFTGQSSNIAGIEIFSERQQKDASLGKQNMLEIEGSESNQTVMKEPEEALPQEPKNPEVKQENLENETEMSICKDNDEEFEKDYTSAEVTITPNLDEQGENGNGLASESRKSYENLVSNPQNTSTLLKLGKSSIEEVKKTYNTRSMYLKDIKESLGRIRAEPLNRVQTTSVGNYSRHAVQEPISVCKEIKMPLRDNARDFGRERAPEFMLTSPPEETSRWRQEQYALQILENVQNSRIAEKTRMEMEIRVLKAQIVAWRDK